MIRPIEFHSLGGDACDEFECRVDAKSNILNMYFLKTCCRFSKCLLLLLVVNISICFFVLDLFCWLFACGRPEKKREYTKLATTTAAKSESESNVIELLTTHTQTYFNATTKH